MRTIIENYRGVEIFFDTDNERFSFSFDDARWNEKQSYSAAKKKIDDFIKETHAFTPFKAISRGDNNLVVVDVVSVRKDGDYMIKDEKGNISKLGQYYEQEYVMYSPSDDKIFAEIAVCQIEIDNLKTRMQELKSPLLERQSLKSMKKSFMPPQ